MRPGLPGQVLAEDGLVQCQCVVLLRSLHFPQGLVGGAQVVIRSADGLGCRLMDQGQLQRFGQVVEGFISLPFAQVCVPHVPVVPAQADVVSLLLGDEDGQNVLVNGPLVVPEGL